MKEVLKRAKEKRETVRELQKLFQKIRRLKKEAEEAIERVSERRAGPEDVETLLFLRELEKRSPNFLVLRTLILAVVSGDLSQSKEAFPVLEETLSEAKKEASRKKREASFLLGAESALSAVRLVRDHFDCLLDPIGTESIWAWLRRMRDEAEKEIREASEKEAERFLKESNRKAQIRKRLL